MKNYTHIFHKKYHGEIEAYLATLQKLSVEKQKIVNPILLMILFFATIVIVFFTMGHFILSVVISATITIFIKFTILYFLTRSIKKKEKKLEEKKKMLQAAGIAVILEFFDDLTKGLGARLQTKIFQENLPSLGYEWIKAEGNGVIFKTHTVLHPPVFIAEGITLLSWSDTAYEGIPEDDLIWFYDTHNIHLFRIELLDHGKPIELIL